MIWRSLLLLVAVAQAAVHQIKVVPNRYIVEFEDGANTTSFHRKVDIGEVLTRKTYSYQLFKGASIELAHEDAAERTLKDLKAMPGVRVWPVTVIPRPNDEVIWTGSPSDSNRADLRKRRDEGEEDTFSTHVQTQIDKLRAKGITGKGIKIAVIDTGIDYKHPALGKCFGSGCLVSFGTDFVGDAYQEGLVPVPGDDPMDCAGHGTHVAGTIAAQHNSFDFTGAAPGATLGAYKVFGCVGGTENDILIDAFNQAYEDGADIITASIGGPSGWSQEPWGVAVQRIIEKGVPCTLAAGNEGRLGMFYAATASSGKGVLSVGSVDNSAHPQLLIESDYTVDDGKVLKFGWAAGFPSIWQDVSAPLLARGYDITDEEDGCAPWPSNGTSLQGKVVLIRRGTCTFLQKARFAAQRGAEYILFYNNAPGILPVDVAGVEGIKAAAMVPAEVGEAWIAKLGSGSEVVVSMVDPQGAERVLLTSENNITGGSPSLFTSWGPTFELDVKPIVSAPGGNILSTYPISLGEYGVLSGTSMSTPLVAGVLALLAEARGTLDPSLMERLLANTAEPQHFNLGQGESPFFAPVPQQGNGLIRAYDAAFTKTLLDKSSISFSDSDHRVESATFSILNESDEDITYEIFNLPAATAYTKRNPGWLFPDMFPNELTEEYAELEFDPVEVTVPAKGEAEITVVPKPPGSLNGGRLPVWSGWISLNASDGSTQRLAYQGVTGSMRSQKVLAEAYLIIIPQAPFTNFKFQHAREGLTFVLPPPGLGSRADPRLVFPGSAYNLAMGTSTVEIEILDAEGESLGPHPESPVKWVSRLVDFVAWDGELAGGEYAEEGTYRFRTRTLRIFGDPEAEEDWEEAESVGFAIEYATVAGPVVSVS